MRTCIAPAKDCLTTHHKSAIEWWFIQGRYKDVSDTTCYFMCSFFRTSVARNKHTARFGHSLILSVLQGTRYRYISKIDPAMLTFISGLPDTCKNMNIDQTLLTAYAKELNQFGVPEPIQLSQSPVFLRSEPLHIKWDDFSLNQTIDGLRLCFTHPLSQKKCDLNIHAKEYMRFDTTAKDRLQTLELITAPCMELSGSHGKKTIKGQAWFDHQWGDFAGWFFKDKQRQSIIGWNWFGIHFDDGSSLMVMIHKDIVHNETLSAYAHYRDNEARSTIIKEIKAVPLKAWQSPHTFIEYPVQWELSLPELKMCLTVTPLALDQEIQIFGPIRGIWQGACKISGLKNHTITKGVCRLELYGYGFICNGESFTKPLVTVINNALETYLPRTLDAKKLNEYIGPFTAKVDAAALTEMLSKPVWENMSNSGKRWRSLFSILLAQTLSVPFEKYKMLLSVFAELSHTGSLIVDDIEDKALLRRGKPCIHLTYGLETALNAANTIYFLPYLLIGTHPDLTDAQRLKLYKIMVEQFSKAHFGQAMDLYWSKKINRSTLPKLINTISEDQILQMYAHKTGSLSEGMAKMTAVLAHASLPMLQHCADFGKTLGIAYQIIDDMSDFIAIKDNGKNLGQDLRTKKITFVILRALHTLKGKKRRQLIEILSANNNTEKSISAGVALVRSSGAMGYAKIKAQQLLENKWQALSTLLPASQSKIMLRLLWTKLLNLCDNTLP